MMANSVRGEIAAKLDGKPWTLCLTLGTLAELESALAVRDLQALSEKFSSGRLKSSELLSIIAAGLKGGGHTLSADEVGEMRVEGGIAGYVDIAARLLAATFGSENVQS